MTTIQLLRSGTKIAFLNVRHRQISTSTVLSTHLHQVGFNRNLKCLTNRGLPHLTSQWPTISGLTLQQLPKFSGSCCCFSRKASPDRAGKSETKSSPALADTDLLGEASNLGLFAKFKLMYKKYWYVLIPVHVVTSIGWYGAFFYMCKSGVDVPTILENLHISESIIQRVQNSEMGNIAIAYLCFKVATPLRYALTLGGTTVSIKYLVTAGHIKPLPSKQQLMDMYEQQKANRAVVKSEKAAEKKKQNEGK